MHSNTAFETNAQLSLNQAKPSSVSPPSSAASRGVRVGVIFDKVNAIDGTDTGCEWVHRLEKAPSASLFRFSAAGMMHVKYMIIDKVWTVAGSLNLTANAPLHNVETSVASNDLGRSSDTSHD